MVPAPSITAASMSSSGTPAWMYWRMRKTPNAVTSVGRITAGRWFARLELGHQHVERNDAHLRRDHHRADHEGQQEGRPRKCSFAKAKPPRVQNETVPIVMRRRDDERVDEALVERRELQRLADVVEEVAVRQRGRRRPWPCRRWSASHDQRVVEREDRDQGDDDEQGVGLPVRVIGPPRRRRRARARHAAVVSIVPAVTADAAERRVQRLRRRGTAQPAPRGGGRSAG